MLNEHQDAICVECAGIEVIVERRRHRSWHRTKRVALRILKAKLFNTTNSSTVRTYNLTFQRARNHLTKTRTTIGKSMDEVTLSELLQNEN